MHPAHSLAQAVRPGRFVRRYTFPLPSRFPFRIIIQPNAVRILLRLGCTPNPPFFFSLQKKTLRAAPCKKASSPNRRPQDKFIFIRAFYNLSFLGRRPKPALLFLIAEKEGKKASTPGSHKIYFYTGILQLPTVGQVKCLYDSVKNKFYRRLQRGALNNNDTAKTKASDNNKSKAENSALFYAVRASARIIVHSMIFQI